MTDYDTRTPESIDLPPRAFRLGVDLGGREHYYSAFDATVWVYSGDECLSEADLDNVVSYVMTVADEIGWESRQPVEETDGFANVVDRGDGVATDGGRDVDEDHVQRNISESADKIRVETKVKRGEGTRDQDEIKVKVKGDDAETVVADLNETVALLEATADDLRAIQPDVPEDDA